MKTLPRNYVESSLEGRRQFELQEAGILVSGDMVMASSFETLILYSQLLPNITTIRRRHPVFWYAVLSFPLFCFAYYAMVAHTGLGWDGFFPGTCVGMALLSIVFMIATYKNIEYARFSSESGVALLDIAKSGPDVASFDEFVNQVQSAIVGAKNGLQQ